MKNAKMNMMKYKMKKAMIKSNLLLEIAEDLVDLSMKAKKYRRLSHKNK